MSRANPRWGAPRVHGELLKLGIDISQAAVSKYMVRHRKPPSQSWRAFLDNHVGDLVSVDFFTVPTVTFRVLFVFVILAHERRRIIHFNVTDAPTAEWTAQIVEAFPWDTAPRYLLRDRDGTYGHEFTSRVDHMGIKEVKTAPRSPWQNPYVERLIGTLRRDCIDHVIVVGENHLRRILREYLAYYHSCRTHLSLEKDSPEPRKVESPDQRKIVDFPMVGGLHHRYSRRAAKPSCHWACPPELAGDVRLLGPDLCLCLELARGRRAKQPARASGRSSIAADRPGQWPSSSLKPPRIQ